MTEQTEWLPRDVDEEIPSAARIYDYLLGGAHNFAADRRLGERFLAALPSARHVARLNRAFLRRAVLTLGEAGIRQFIDIGSGIPTVGNVHEIAREVDPDSKVVYVDNEPVAVAHSELLLRDDPNAVMLQADLLDPEGVFGHPRTAKLLDLSRPVGLLMVGVLHFAAPEHNPVEVMRRYREALPAGSYLAVSHFTADIRPREMREVSEVMRQSADPIHPRSRPEITELFEGFELLEPGVVGTALWRPEDESHADVPGASQIYAGVGYKK
ncbi:S-adenosyl methyltransferase [Actinopolyspora xinjiangensis]|uniref:S-adenosyl methyltransferase n=1 Tax=Actinopolyspora xinjiangensis TaxID=405564 RepID=A0A1H0SKS1_9ACTN|nr:SAM-dependent methyltransferase [Actinopolyspora xinjiangensis]SDP42343.1 S-adenosyl methyltransferase [Actinopolyspora xinjiangensis]